jgi:hypothetical protein
MSPFVRRGDIITSVRSVKKAYHTSDFLLTSYHPETKNLDIQSTKMGITLVRIVEKSSLTNLT